MPIPAFDRFGLLPDGIHECTIKEVEVDLAWTDERRRLTAQLREFISVELTPRFTLMPPLVLGQMLFQRRAELLGCYRVDVMPSLKGLQQDFVALLQTLRPETAFEKGLHHKHRKGVLRLI